MKISLEKNLEDLKEFLSDKGHTIVAVSEAADAHIYSDTPIMQITAKNFSPISALSTDPMLLVNAKNKTFDEIAQILEQKSYNKIF